MLADVFELKSGGYGYIVYDPNRNVNIIQDIFPGIEGFVLMTKEQAEEELQNTLDLLDSVEETSLTEGQPEGVLD